jgi:hypothetical protein
MVAAVAEALPESAREHRWKAILVALAAFLLVPLVDQLRVLVPLEQTILLLGPAVAVSALVAWLGGGRFWLAAGWVVLAIWMLSRPLPGAGAYDALARGWAMLLASIWGLVNLVSMRRPFLSRALSTLAFTFVFAAGVVLITSVSPSRLERALSDELTRRATASATKAKERVATPEWRRFASDHPALVRFIEESDERFENLPAFTLRLFPALLALESLAALSLAWGIFHRISRVRIGPPLGPLRGFRLSDQMIWGFLAGLAIVAVPSLAALRGLGLNLVLFFGALYALRGLGVLTWFIAPRGLAMPLFVVLAVLFWPIAALVSICLGLVDNWIDWRGAARQMT